VGGVCGRYDPLDDAGRDEGLNVGCEERAEKCGRSSDWGKGYEGNCQSGHPFVVSQ